MFKIGEAYAIDPRRRAASPGAPNQPRDVDQTVRASWLPSKVGNRLPKPIAVKAIEDAMPMKRAKSDKGAVLT